MTYHNVKVHLTKSQLEKIAHAIKNETGCTIRIEMNSNGHHHLLLTERHHNKLMKGGLHDIELSKTHIKHLKKMHPDLKSGGFLPLAALIPLIASALAGVGGITGGIATAVTKAKDSAEMARHNREVEKSLGNGLHLFPPQTNARGGNIINHYKELSKLGQPHKEIIKYLRKTHGSGVVADFLRNIPLLGSVLGPIASTIGLGHKACKCL